MPSAAPSLTTEDVQEYVRSRCFTPASGRVGAEVEWLTFPAAGDGHPPFETVRAAAEATQLPGGGRITFEPGGQIEISTSPGDAIATACETAAADIASVRRSLNAAGVRLVGVGLDPIRPGRRVLEAERYRAMEAYFDADGSNGRTMMCRTAAIQVNVDSGTHATFAERWRLAHALGPVLAASFANSPFLDGEPTGWRSTRMANWWAMDETRTAPANAGRSPFDDWANYLLRARVMLIRVTPARFAHMSQPLSFARWIDEGHELGFPTIDDLEYHATTMFPPVRARGWLEIRVIDALPDPWWRVAVAVPAALLDDEEAFERAERATAPAALMWHEAFRSGLRHPVIADAASACFAAALDAMPRLGADAGTIAATAAYLDRYVARGRCPADDLLETHALAGSVSTIDLRSAEPAWT